LGAAQIGTADNNLLSVTNEAHSKSSTLNVLLVMVILVTSSLRLMVASASVLSSAAAATPSYPRHCVILVQMIMPNIVAVSDLMNSLESHARARSSQHSSLVM
jgi:hypothetical protein